MAIITMRSHRMPSKTLLHNSIDVRQAWSVAEKGQPIRSYDLIKFCLGTFPHFRIHCHGLEECIDGPSGLKQKGQVKNECDSIIDSEIRTVSGPAALIDAAVHLIVNSSSVPSLRWSATNEDSLLPEALQILVNWGNVRK